MRSVGRRIAQCCAVFAMLAPGVLQAANPLPTYYQENGLQPFRAALSTPLDEHVDPFTGKLQLHHVDVVIPGNGGFDLALQRSYNSPGSTYGSTSETYSYNRTPNLGVGWSLLPGGRLYVGDACTNASSHQMVFETPDGGRQPLIRTGSGDFRSPAQWRALCTGETVEAASVVHVFSPAGIRYRMAKPIAEAIPNTIQAASFMYATEIRDSNDNTAALTYSAIGTTKILSSITTSDGRSVTFSYAPYGRLQLLDRVTTAGGSWTFAYAVALNDGSGVGVAYQLTRATPPAGGPWVYGYNLCPSSTAGSCALNRITYPQGGAIDYGYARVDFYDGTGASSVVTSKSGATGSWTFAYAPGSGSVPDTTTVGTPLGTMIYKHLGYRNIGFGTSWQAGLLVERRTGSVEVETFNWTRQQISIYPTQRGYSINDGVTYAPLLAGHTRTRSGATFTTTYGSFDTYGNPGTIAESGVRSRTITRSYCINPAKWIVNRVATESFSGTSISRSFDANCNLTAESRHGVTTLFGRNAAGDMTSRTDANNKTTHFSGHYRGIPTTESRPDGATIARGVDAMGNLTSQSDGAGNTHRYTFDGLRRPTSWNPPTGAAMSIGWGSASRSASRGGYTENAAFDGVGNPLDVTRAGIKRTYVHDAFQRLTFESLPGQTQGTSISRDILGRPLSITHADATRRLLSYSGNAVAVTDERDKVTTYRYEGYADPDRRFLVGIDLPEGRSITIGRDALGNITSVSQGAITRRYGYNSRYQLTSIVDPETGTTTFERDTVGNMTAMIVDGRRTQYQYDPMNRLTRIAYPDGEITTIAYDGDGRTRSIGNGKASLAYGYDANRNVISETITVDGLTFTTAYTYSTTDALASIRYPRTGELLDLAPDALGRPTRVAGYVNSITHHASGNLASMSFANGVTTTYTESARQWPSRVRASKGTTFLDKSYAFDPAGNVKRIDDAVDAARSLALGYNDVNELVSASGPWGSGSLAYDNVGNITAYTLGGVSRSYAYASGNRLTSFDGRSVGYDGYGNVISDGRHTYGYSDAPNLTCVDCAAASRIDYAYDGNNRRVWRTQHGVKTYYVHASGGDLLLEYTPSTNTTVQHVYVKGQRVATKTITP